MSARPRISRSGNNPSTIDVTAFVRDVVNGLLKSAFGKELSLTFEPDVNRRNNASCRSRQLLYPRRPESLPRSPVQLDRKLHQIHEVRWQKSPSISAVTNPMSSSASWITASASRKNIRTFSRNFTASTTLILVRSVAQDSGSISVVALSKPWTTHLGRE